MHWQKRLRPANAPTSSHRFLIQYVWSSAYRIAAPSLYSFQFKWPGLVETNLNNRFVSPYTWTGKNLACSINVTNPSRILWVGGYGWMERAEIDTLWATLPPQRNSCASRRATSSGSRATAALQSSECLLQGEDKLFLVMSKGARCLLIHAGTKDSYWSLKWCFALFAWCFHSREGKGKSRIQLTNAFLKSRREARWQQQLNVHSSADKVWNLLSLLCLQNFQPTIKSSGVSE